MALELNLTLVPLVETGRGTNFLKCFLVPWKKSCSGNRPIRSRPLFMDVLNVLVYSVFIFSLHYTTYSAHFSEAVQLIENIERL